MARPSHAPRGPGRSPHRGAPRGYSLVELLLAVGIGVIVIGGALYLMVTQQHNFQATSGDRALQETARIALDELTNNLRQAGYGVDPALVFDFGDLSAARMEAGPDAGTFSTVSTDCNSDDALCRDSTTSPDEISFLARDPLFGPHPIVSPTSFASAPTSITIAGPLTSPILKGQLLQVVCYTGNMSWAYVTVSQYQASTTSSSVTLYVTQGDTLSTFPNQTASLADGCFDTPAVVDSTVTTFPQVTTASLASATKVFKIDRYRYFIQSYDTSGDVVSWGTTGARPYLMLDQGLTDSDGIHVISAIAPDVEDLQFAYLFPLASADQQVGATTDTAITDDDTAINLSATAPIYSDATTSSYKTTHHPGNIRAVQVSMVIRSPQPDLRVPGDPLPAAGNRAAITKSDHLRRLLVQTTVAVRNLSMLLPLYPSYDIGADGGLVLNAGGG